MLVGYHPMADGPDESVVARIFRGGYIRGPEWYSLSYDAQRILRCVSLSLVEFHF